MNILERARASGKCPPSLFCEEPKEDGFEAAIAKVLDANELSLSAGTQIVDDFESLLQIADRTDSIPADSVTKNKILAQRRCVILAIVGATPSSNSTLPSILQNGFLSTVKSWLDDILNGSIGGVDLLLHMLTNITNLPVTKSLVKESGMGKAIGSIEKNKICAGTPNEIAVKERVKGIKDAWNKSVKALKEKNAGPSSKRQVDVSPTNTSPPSKKAKLEDTKKSTFSTLLKKMKPPSSVVEGPKDSENAKSSEISKAPSEVASEAAKEALNKKLPKKQTKRVKWKDHFGGTLVAAKILESDNVQPEEAQDADTSVSWSDRRRRDRLREKELLAQAKKSKLLDDDDMGMDMPVTKTVQTTTAWRAPSRLPDRSDAPPPQVNSKEVVTQTSRMATATAARYASDFNVPANPTPLSDVEQALDMTSQSSTVVQTLPFFVPQQAPAPAPAIPPAPAPSASYSLPGVGSAQAGGLGVSIPPAQPRPDATVATAEVVQSLGLPMFLVGQNVQALQTLAGTPSLLSTFVDSNGMYDQARLTSLVQTLTQNIAPAQQQPVGQMGNVGVYQQKAPSSYGAGGQQQPLSSVGAAGSSGIYGPASNNYGSGSTSQGQYGGGGWQGSSIKSGYRGDQNNGEGNLHLSGYGPATTQADIITLFGPYVKVDEVVMKGTFCFVNTSDPVAAKRAREALNGAYLGGAPVRINPAQRKNRDNAAIQGRNFGSFYNKNAGVSTMGFSQGLGGSAQNLPTSGAGDEFDNIRDDRGNPVTKNLFVAGYGPGTSEQQIRELFSQHANIIGIIMKGTFSFVNTSDRSQAVTARETLSGTMLNGGVLRINFAKETGRLGTSFDLTYSSGPPSGAPHSHYGRGF